MKQQKVNGYWNGIVQELHEKNADIGLSVLTVTEERSELVDFTVGLNIDSIRLWMQIPRPQLFTCSNLFS